jgi:hypothetical protein
MGNEVVAETEVEEVSTGVTEYPRVEDVDVGTDGAAYARVQFFTSCI